MLPLLPLLRCILPDNSFMRCWLLEMASCPSQS